MGSPKVSAVLPAYNEERWIADAIDSVLAQTFEDFELIVVDDGSTDRTPEIVREYDDPRIESYQQENAGSAAARNTALKHSSGEYVAIIDADDMWKPEKLERQIAAIEDADAEFSHTNMELVDEAGTDLGLWHNSPPPEQTDRETYATALFLRMFVCHPTVVFHRDAVADREFDETLTIVHDHDLCLRIVADHDAIYVDEPLATKRQHDQNISGSYNYEQLYEERLQFVKKNTKQLPFLADVQDRKLSEIHLTYGINLAVDGYGWRGRSELLRGVQYRPTNWKVYPALVMSFVPSLLNIVTQQR
jgi:glycosyltransferase involved in cell wall biosynthesis